MKRKEPMKRSAFKRKPGSLDAALKKYHGLKRKKRLGPGKKTKAKRFDMDWAEAHYFNEQGWNHNGERYAHDQVTGQWLWVGNSIPHHKTPRSELRKAWKRGDPGIDEPKNLIICHWAVHLKWVHANSPGGMGRPYVTHTFTFPEGPKSLEVPTDEYRRFRIIEDSPANATNGLCVAWSDQDRDDLFRFLGVNNGSN